MNTTHLLLNTTRIIVSGWTVNAAAQEIADELGGGTSQSGTRAANPKFHHTNEREERLKRSVKHVLGRVGARNLTATQRRVLQARESDLRWHVRSELTRRINALKEQSRRDNPLGTPIEVNRKPLLLDTVVHTIMRRMRERRMQKQLRVAFEKRSAELFDYIKEHKAITAYLKRVEKRGGGAGVKSRPAKSDDKGSEPAPAPVAPASNAPIVGKSSVGGRWVMATDSVMWKDQEGWKLLPRPKESLSEEKTASKRKMPAPTASIA